MEITKATQAQNNSLEEVGALILFAIALACGAVVYMLSIVS